MKNLGIDVAAGRMAATWWTAGVSSVRRWVSIEKNLLPRRLVPAPWLSSAALAIALSACGGGGSTSGTSSPAPAPAPAQPTQASISGNVRAPGGIIKAGIVGTELAAFDAVAVDRQLSVMASKTQQLSGASASNFLPLKKTTFRGKPPGCFPVKQKPVVLRTLQTFGPTYGPAIAQTTTDANGDYSINIPNGTDPTLILVITVGASNEAQMSSVVTGDTVDVDPVTEAALQVLMNYARRNNLSSIDLELTAELVGNIDDIAATMPALIDARSAANAYVQAAANSASVNSALTAQLPGSGTGGSPIDGSGTTPIGGAGIAPGAPDTPPPPNPKPGTWYAHFSVRVCVPGAACFSQAATSPGNNAYDAQASCLEGGRQVAAALNASAVPGLTYSYVCNQTP